MGWLGLVKVSILLGEVARSRASSQVRVGVGLGQFCRASKSWTQKPAILFDNAEICECQLIILQVISLWKGLALRHVTYESRTERPPGLQKQHQSEAESRSFGW
jgi:hypothetical protein